MLFALTNPARCYNCDRRLLKDEIAKVENEKDDRDVNCLRCAGLEQLAFLASGNATLTRLAKKYSKQLYVVVKWSETWKCYERQGLLVEEEALERAQKEAPRQ